MAVPFPTPSQVAHPGRAALRTGFQLILALAALLPVLISAAGIPTSGAIVGGVLAVALAITRIMALPGVNDLIAQFAPWLLAEPRT